jgi:thiol:disulfide interchange protein DsbC
MKLNTKPRRGAWIAVVACLMAGSVALAEDSWPQGSEKLVSELRRTMPTLPIEEVTTTPLADIYAVDLPGGQTLYGTADGKYLFSGDMYQLGDNIVNLAEGRRALKRQQLMQDVPLDELVVFSPAGETRDYINVFTDVDCGYCRKLHQEMADINALGIEVRYLGYPRAGLGTPTYTKIVSAWCAKNPNEAITALKSGLDIPAADCDNPIAEHYALGQKVGVTGTPAIITSDGRLLPGYMPAENLAEALGLQQ